MSLTPDQQNQLIAFAFSLKEYQKVLDNKILNSDVADFYDFFTKNDSPESFILREGLEVQKVIDVISNIEKGLLILKEDELYKQQGFFTYYWNKFTEWFFGLFPSNSAEPDDRYENIANNVKEDAIEKKINNISALLKDFGLIVNSEASKSKEAYESTSYFTWRYNLFNSPKEEDVIIPVKTHKEKAYKEEVKVRYGKIMYSSSEGYNCCFYSILSYFKKHHKKDLLEDIDEDTLEKLLEDLDGKKLQDLNIEEKASILRKIYVKELEAISKLNEKKYEELLGYFNNMYLAFYEPSYEQKKTIIDRKIASKNIKVDKSNINNDHIKYNTLYYKIENNTLTSIKASDADEKSLTIDLSPTLDDMIKDIKDGCMSNTYTLLFLAAYFNIEIFYIMSGDKSYTIRDIGGSKYDPNNNSIGYAREKLKLFFKELPDNEGKKVLLYNNKIHYEWVDISPEELNKKIGIKDPISLNPE